MKNKYLITKDDIKGVQINQSLKNFANALKARLANDWDSVIALSGYEGTGKSTLAIWLGILTDGNGFDLDQNAAYLPDHTEIEGKFEALKPKSVFVVDEAAKVLYKLRWMDKLQVRLNQMYQTERWQNKCTILCIPRFTDLNDYFRNHRVMIWIHLVERGLGVAFIPDDVNIWNPDPWHMRENATRIKKYMHARKKLIQNFTLDEKMALFRRASSYFFDFTWDKLPENIWEKYQALKIQYRQKIPEEKNELMLRIVRGLLEKDFSQREISEIIGRPQSYVSRLLRGGVA
jgi:predicted XRE-type DNA-binding protein